MTRVLMITLALLLHGCQPRVTRSATGLKDFNACESFCAPDGTVSHWAEAATFSPSYCWCAPKMEATER